MPVSPLAVLQQTQPSPGKPNRGQPGERPQQPESVQLLRGFDGMGQGSKGRWELALKKLVPGCSAITHQVGPYTLLCSQHSCTGRVAFRCSCFVPDNSISPGLTMLSLKNTSLHHADAPRGTVLKPLIKQEVKNCELELRAESSKKQHWKARSVA